MIEYRGEDVIVSHMRDLTEQVAIEEELDAQRETLFQNEKLSALGELLAGVAHELNNPLSVVVGHSLMLLEEATDPDVRRGYGADRRRGRALRAHRQDVPGHGAAAAGARTGIVAVDDLVRGARRRGRLGARVPDRLRRSRAGCRESWPTPTR